MAAKTEGLQQRWMSFPFLSHEGKRHINGYQRPNGLLSFPDGTGTRSVPCPAYGYPSSDSPANRTRALSSRRFRFPPHRKIRQELSRLQHTKRESSSCSFICCISKERTKANCQGVSSESHVIQYKTTHPSPVSKRHIPGHLSHIST